MFHIKPVSMQGEPEFDRLKRELEEVKNQPRGLEGTFRTAAEMERHRAQLADAAIEEQLEVQTAFREHGARLQVIFRTAMFSPLLFIGSSDHPHQLMAVLMHTISLTPQLRCTLCRMYLTKAYVISLRKTQTGCSRFISYTPDAPALCFPDIRDMSLPCSLYFAVYPAQLDVNPTISSNASVMFSRAFMTSGSAQSTRWSTVSRRSNSCKAGPRQS